MRPRTLLLLTLILSAAAILGTRLMVSPQAPTVEVPVIVGWGGPKGDESSLDSTHHDGSNPPSVVFPGEQASNFETQALRLQSMGFNVIRFSFAPACTNDEGGFMYPYSQTNVERAIAVAEHFDFWIIVDYHGYDDLNITSLADCWLNFWGPVVQQFKERYSKLIWEPLNEPKNLPGGDTDVAYLSQQYQRWIDQARALGDQHWIVVQNLCSYSCGFNFDNGGFAEGFPTVNDSSQNKIFISLHSYMDYGVHGGSWDNVTAEYVAQNFYQAVLNGIEITGWPVLNTEGGTDPLCRNACAPHTILDGSAGYTTVSLHFIMTLTTLYDTHTPQRINWVWWPMASWTDTPNSRPYGALQCGSNPEAWGCLLQYQRVASGSSSPTNSRPFLSVPATQTVEKTQTLSFEVAALDGDSPAQTLTLSCVGCQAIGASFFAVSGSSPLKATFSWTPDASQTPGDYSVTFQVVDDGNPSESYSRTVTFHVTEAGSSEPPPGQPPPGGGCSTCSTVLGWLNDYWLFLAGAALGLTAVAAYAKSRARKMPTAAS